MFFGIIIVLALVLVVVSDSYAGEVSEVAKGFLIDKMYSQLR